MPRRQNSNHKRNNVSLDRFVNRDSLIQLNEPQYGQVFSSDEMKLLAPAKLYFEQPELTTRLYPELHIYSFYGDYIAGDHHATNYLLYDKGSNSLLVDLVNVFKEANIARGSYIVNINLLSPVFGDIENPPFLVDEISPDRTEVKLIISPIAFQSGEVQALETEINKHITEKTLSGVVLNFGYNRLYPLSNFKFDRFVPDVVYVKLSKPLPDDIIQYDAPWLDYECADTYSDTVILTTDRPAGVVKKIGGPNFALDSEVGNSNSTIFKSWDDLLDANSPTAQNIIDASLSGSGTAALNIDYTDYNNFIFYSSAEERLRNFKYKVELLEGYSTTITTLNATTASSTVYISQSVATYQNRIDGLKSTFDSFERWLYYHTTQSIFSHDQSGSLTPYPKYLQNSQYVVHHSTSSIATTWFNNNVYSASLYDSTNQNRLYWSIPEHVLMDEGNSQYITFVDMIGQHFDSIYAYISALTKIHERDEHPERGMSNSLLFHVAKSYGWKLQNIRQLSSLWLYKLGTDNTGDFEHTGSLFSLPHEQQTHQVWRRIVNNLPYLLKTKGTERSVKALLSIYGIPQTLISIKEYGGPSVAADKPTIIEDRYYYSLNLSGSQYVQLPRRVINTTSGSWGGVARVPDTVEFRFASNYSSSVSMSLWAIEDSLNRSVVNANLEMVHVTASYASSSISGSQAYGYLRFSYLAKSGSSTVLQRVSSSYLPIFDNDYWSVRIWTPTGLSDSVLSASINFEVGRVSDALYGRIVHTQSFTYTSTYDMADAWSAKAASSASYDYIVLGGTTGSNSNRFIGKINGYKEYFDVIDKATFDSHILNPAAYHSNTPTSSFYTLFRYFPLGLDVQRWDHDEYLQVSSSHPNRLASFDTTASFYNFTGSQAAQYAATKETYYIYSPSLGGNTFRSEKIRLEDERLIRDLSPSSKSTIAKYDYASLDSNRLAIVFSTADHANRDIFNHMGFSELDTWIGDPQYEFEEGYSELNRFNAEYWKKYQQKNDINGLIRLLSLYDYTFFEQLKQLVPGRADLISGILIEPTILEQNKVILSKRPTIENPQYEQEIGYSITESGEYPTYETQFSGSMTLVSRYKYLSASIDDPLTLTSRYKYLSGSIDDPLWVTGSVRSHLGTGSKQTCGEIDVYPTRYSGSQEVTQSVIDGYTTHCRYKRVIYHYSSSGTFATKYLRQWYTAVSMSYKMHYSRSLETWNYPIDEDSTQNNSRFTGTKMSAPGFNQNSPDTIDGGPLIEIYESNPNSINVGSGGENELLVD